MSTYTLKSRLPSTTNRRAGIGPLQQYGVFRWHSGGNPWFLLGRIGPNAGIDSVQVGMRVGLRNRNGVQVSGTLVFGPRERSRKYWSHVPQGTFALNARSAPSTDAVAANGSFWWEGYLGLI